MGELNIYTLPMMVRGFSNEVTVNGLASRLGISYSTLARCKNGVWPRSVKFEAMRGVFDRCRDRFFDGDDDRLMDSALGYLERQEIDVSDLVSARARGGYDAFVTELISEARSARGGDSVALPVPASTTALAVPADAAPEATGTPRAGFSGLVVALPLAAVLLVGLLNIPLGDLLTLAAENQLAFALILLAIAVSPVVAGVLVDAPLAWHAYRRSHPEAGFTWRDFRLVSKYGGVEEVVPGAGRFDFTRLNCGFQLGCNVLGALCTISLLAFLTWLPGFAAFFEQHQWTEFFKVGIAVGFFVALSHNREHRLLAPCARVGDAHNPDCNLPTRVHVWANTLHLIVTLTIVCVLTLGLIAYSFVNFRVYPAPLLVLWPLLQTIGFLVYEGVSPAAVRMEALGVGSFEPGVIASSAGIAVLVLVCYRFSWEMVAICLVCAACLAGARAWRRSVAVRGVPAWVEHGRRSGAYSIAIVAALAVMFAIGVATGSLV